MPASEAGSSLVAQMCFGREPTGSAGYPEPGKQVTKIQV